MKNDEAARLENAHNLAFDVVGEAFELLAIVERYKVAKKVTRKKQLAEQFLDHLYELHDAWQTLRQASLLFQKMAAFADGRCKVGQLPAASAHAAVITIGHEVVSECGDEFFRCAFPDEWPPRDPEREYIMPDKLPCRKDVTPHVQAMIVRFQKKIDLPLDDLNDVSARLEQEYARASLRTPESKGETHPPSIVLNSLQQAILAALDGQALKKLPLAHAVCAGEGTRLYRKNGIKELVKAGLVAHAHGIGYYRPDAPPPGLIVPIVN